MVGKWTGNGKENVLINFIHVHETKTIISVLHENVQDYVVLRARKFNKLTCLGFRL